MSLNYFIRSIRLNYLIKSILYVKLRSFLRIFYHSLRRSPKVTGTIFYESYLWFKIASVLKNELNLFSRKNNLPKNYGFGLSERIIELPWVIANMPKKSGLHFDAGSSLNFYDTLFHPIMKNKKIFIGNLNPERNCYWTDGISYIYSDLRKPLFIDNYFDSISCISVLEHVGLNNKVYTSNKMFHENKSDDYITFVKELKRTLKPGGTCFISVPFGKYENLGWLQNFDIKMINNIISKFKPRISDVTYYKYTKDGWILSNESECKDSTYSKAYPGNDYCVGAHAVALLRLVK